MFDWKWLERIYAHFLFFRTLIYNFRNRHPGKKFAYFIAQIGSIFETFSAHLRLWTIDYLDYYHRLSMDHGICSLFLMRYVSPCPSYAKATTHRHNQSLIFVIVSKDRFYLYDGKCRLDFDTDNKAILKYQLVYIWGPMTGSNYDISYVFWKWEIFWWENDEKSSFPTSMRKILIQSFVKIDSNWNFVIHLSNHNWFFTNLLSVNRHLCSCDIKNIDHGTWHIGYMI